MMPEPKSEQAKKYHLQLRNSNTAYSLAFQIYLHSLTVHKTNFQFNIFSRIA